jgi:hypothetical protein
MVDQCSEILMKATLPTFSLEKLSYIQTFINNIIIEVY